MVPQSALFTVFPSTSRRRAAFFRLASRGHDLARGAGLLAGAPGGRARHRRDLFRRVPGRAPAVHPALGRARPPAGDAVHRVRAVPDLTEPVPPALLRPPAPHVRLGGPRPQRARRRGYPRLLAARGRTAPLDRAVGALPLDRERRSDLLQLRLGDAAPRGRLPRDLPRPRLDPHSARARLPPAVARVPPRVRRGAHQDARRRVLARPHLPLLPPRDPADAEPPELV